MKDGMKPMDCAVELMSDEEFMNELGIDNEDVDESKRARTLKESYDDDEGEEMHWTERSRRDDDSNEEEAERFNSMLALVGNIPEDIVDDVLDDVFKVLESKYSEALVDYFADKIQMDNRIWYDDEDDRMYFNDMWSGDDGSAALDDVMEMLSKYEDKE
jgi:L-fucose isomerase-like protein